MNDRTTPSTITLTGDFDSGGLDVGRCRVDGDVVHLAGRDNFNPGQWKWLHFRAAGVRGRRLTFEIDDHFEPGRERLDRHRMVYSYDGRTWQWFDRHEHLADPENLYRFGLDHAFDRDEVIVAYGIPYPVSRASEMIARVRSHPSVSPTPSADASLVLGRSAGGVDDTGRRIDPHPLYGFRIREGDPHSRRARVVLMGGVHPNEPLGNHVLEGFVRFGLADEPAAATLRHHAEVMVYPMVNPDGRYAGYNRSTVQHPGRDANRCWRPDLWSDMDEVRIIGESLLRDVGDRPDYFIDFHCWTDTTGHFGILSHEQGFADDPFWRELRRLEPGIGTSDSGWKNPSTETFAFKTLCARFCMTFETMFIPGETIERLHELGANMGRALATVLSQRPDRCLTENTR